MTARTMIDLTPSWSEFGRLYARLAESGELEAVGKLRGELAKAMAAAQALLELGETLTPRQIALRDRVLQRELLGQLGGLPPPSVGADPVDTPSPSNGEGG